MEGPFAVNLHEWGLFNSSLLPRIEIKCQIVRFRHLGRPRNTHAILLFAIVTGWHLLMSISRMSGTALSGEEETPHQRRGATDRDKYCRAA
jgi:hypothetical protein